MTKPIVAHGHTVPVELLDQACEWIRGQHMGFDAFRLETLLIGLGVPRMEAKQGSGDVSNCVANQLLQRERRAWRIEFTRGKWWPIAPATKGGGGGSKVQGK